MSKRNKAPSYCNEESFDGLSDFQSNNITNCIPPQTQDEMDDTVLCSTLLIVLGVVLFFVKLFNYCTL